jgi:hypothetical protein
VQQILMVAVRLDVFVVGGVDPSGKVEEFGEESRGILISM